MNGRDYVVLDYGLICAGAQERVHAGHELGHCMTGSFYCGYSPLEDREKCEATADRWAIRKLIPLGRLRRALRSGCTEPWELAEFFEVTEAFIRKACTYWADARGETL